VPEIAKKIKMDDATISDWDFFSSQLNSAPDGKPEHAQSAAT
jgi:hypothetical protein